MHIKVHNKEKNYFLIYFSISYLKFIWQIKKIIFSFLKKYTRGYGHQRLVNVLSKLYSRLLGVEINSQSDILITVGAYLSLYYAFVGWLNPGDEVISK